MRQLDNNLQFFDNDGNFLFGRVIFCQKGTTSQEPVYTWDSENEQYVPSTAIQYISIDGRPAAQIFLADKDYTAYVEKYIGSGEMQTDTDPANWVAQYSFNNLFKTFELSLDDGLGRNILAFNTLSDFKGNIPSMLADYNVTMYAALLGWYAKGDKPITYYYWDPNCNEAATDVEFVKPYTTTGAGRWVLVQDFDEGFDVRCAGCFPTATSAGTAQQTYGMQKANAYCVKYGLKMVIPHTLGTGYSYYALSNVIVNAYTEVQDGVRLVTNDSATFNHICNSNAERTEPFIIRDSSNTGAWTIGADELHTAWFKSIIPNDSNWRPTMNIGSRLVYDATFDSAYDAASDRIAVTGKEVFLLVATMDGFDFTRCEIHSQNNIKCVTNFVSCNVSEGIFAQNTYASDIMSCGFNSCTSGVGEWSDMDLYVAYCIKNGESVLDLQGGTCTLDFYGDSIEHPFKTIINAKFEHLIPPSSGGTWLGGEMKLVNVVVDSFEVPSANANLTMLNLRDSTITIDSTHHSDMSACALTCRSSKVAGASMNFKWVYLNQSETESALNALDGALTLKDSYIGAIVSADPNSSNTFYVVVDNNTFYGNSGTSCVYLHVMGYSNLVFSRSSFCNNVMLGTTRNVVSFAAWNFDAADCGDYVYKNNTNVLRGERYRQLVKVPYYKSGDTIPPGTTKYIQQISSGRAAQLHGFTIRDLLFNFGEASKKAVYACVNSEHIGGVNAFYSVSSLGNVSLYTDGASATVWSVIPEIMAAGISATHEIYGSGTDVDADFSIDDTFASGTDISFILQVEYVEP